MSIAQEGSYAGFKDWFVANLGEDAHNIAAYGADAGYGHITYISDCVKVYEQFEEEIWAMLMEDSEDCGHKNIMEFVSTFNRSDMLDDPDRFKNLLVWYACERIAHEVVEEEAA